MKFYLFFLVVAVQLIWGCNGADKKSKSIDELTLADASVVWWMAPGIIAQNEKLYEKNQLKVTSFDVQTGLNSKNAVLSGSADIGLVASTPLALGAFSKENLIVLCSYIESSHILSLITQKTADASNYSIPQTPVAIVKGTISEIYFYNYLTKYFPNEKSSIISNQLNVKPADVGNAMKSGNAKSAVIWEPFGTIIAKSDEEKFKENRVSDIYTHRIYIVTTEKILKNKKTAIEKFVRSIDQACDLLNSNASKGKAILTKAFPQQTSSMNALWNKVDFSLKFDYDRMKELILNDVKIMSELGQTPKGRNELDSTDLDYYFNHDFKFNK